MNARLEVTTPEVKPVAGTEVFALNAEQAIGQIAVKLPGATAIFRRLKLDFCCGGQISLKQATLDKGLDCEAVVRELSALQFTPQLPAHADASALVDHILTRYHEVHRKQLPELIRMARRVEAVHRDHPDVPVGLAELLEGMEEELLSHMQKEETVLFPAFKAGGYAFVSQPIAMMRSEHVDHGAQLDKLLQLTHDATPPAGACNTWQALYAGIAQLDDDLINHIHLENNVLFTQFEAATEATMSCGSGGCGCN